MWKKNSQHSTLTPGKGFCSIWLSVLPKVQKNHVLTRLRSPQILRAPPPSIGLQVQVKSTGYCISVIFEISTPKERFLTKISPKCQNPQNWLSPKFPEVPRSPPKFPEIPRNSPKSPDFRMVCAPHRNYEYWVMTLDPRKQQKVGATKFLEVPQNSVASSRMWPTHRDLRLERKSWKWTFGHNFYQFLRKLPVLDMHIPNPLGLIEILPNQWFSAKIPLKNAKWHLKLQSCEIWSPSNLQWRAAVLWGISCSQTLSKDENPHVVEQRTHLIKNRKKNRTLRHCARSVTHRMFQRWDFCCWPTATRIETWNALNVLSWPNLEETLGFKFWSDAIVCWQSDGHVGKLPVSAKKKQSGRDSER